MTTALLCSRQLVTPGHYEQIRLALARIGTLVLHHGGEGAAEIHANAWATETGRGLVAHLPDWAGHGRAAGPMRGRALVAAADTVLALWDRKSRGTAAELKEARRLRKRVILLLAD